MPHATLISYRWLFYFQWGGLALASATLLMLLGALLMGVLPTLAGYESFVVRSGSMSPYLGIGDLTVVSSARTDQLTVGDVVTYRTPHRPDMVITHRLVGILNDDEGRLVFHTKGDANSTVDQVAIDPSAVLGRVVYAVPFIGYVVDFAGRPEGKLCLIALPLALLGVDKWLTMRRHAPPAGRPAGWMSSDTGSLVSYGRIALSSGQTALAIAMFDRAIQADPTTAEAWLLKAACLGTAYERLNCLRSGLVANPRSDELARALAVAESTSGYLAHF